MDHRVPQNTIKEHQNRRFSSRCLPVARLPLRSLRSQVLRVTLSDLVESAQKAVAQIAVAQIAVAQIATQIATRTVIPTAQTVTEQN